MRIDILSIFPEYFSPLDVSLIGKARQRGVLDVRVHDLRQWAYDRHRTVDDTPYGGGPGMVMKPEPWGEALDTIAPPPFRSPPPPSEPSSGVAPQTGPNIESPSGIDPKLRPGSGPGIRSGSGPGIGSRSDTGVGSGVGSGSGGGTGVGSGTGSGVGPGSGGGSEIGFGVGPGSGVGPEAGSDVRAGAGGRSGVGSDSGPGIGSRAESSFEAGSELGSRAGSGPGSGGWSETGSGVGSRAGSGVWSESESRVDPGAGSSAASSGAGPSSSPATGPATPRLVIPTPSGRPFTQALAVTYAAEPWLIFGCGRYEGIDSRVVEEARTRMPVDEVSIGDYVLAGGEAAVLVMIEAIGRLLPGVLGNAESAMDDSFAPGRMETLLEGPIYTKPPVWRDRAVPEILFSGHHAQIARWRRDEALRRTAAHRPELLERLDPETLDARDREVLDEAGPPEA